MPFRIWTETLNTDMFQTFAFKTDKITKTKNASRWGFSSCDVPPISNFNQCWNIATKHGEGGSHPGEKTIASVKTQRHDDVGFPRHGKSKALIHSQAGMYFKNRLNLSLFDKILLWEKHIQQKMHFISCIKIHSNTIRHIRQNATTSKWKQLSWKHVHFDQGQQNQLCWTLSLGNLAC